GLRAVNSISFRYLKPTRQSTTEIPGRAQAPLPQARRHWYNMVPPLSTSYSAWPRLNRRA
ncbi:Uncharacterized protein APZ42_000446, partial [Daphnia magna]